jgi:hypothetical protein
MNDHSLDAAAPDYIDLFRRYAQVYEQSLHGPVHVSAIRAFFAEAFLAASLDGRVAAGSNDEAFGQSLARGFEFYRSIGNTSMHVDRVEAHALCEGHDRVRVHYTAGYRRKDGGRVAIRFDVLYLMQRRDGRPRIIGFFAGDEMAAYRKHGLIDDANATRAEPAVHGSWR